MVHPLAPNSTFLSGVEIGEKAMIAAGAILTRDVPPKHLTIGSPARIKKLHKNLKHY
jgi:acetyltransferase-like isoleucine patch superfamily enzyme